MLIAQSEKEIRPVPPPFNSVFSDEVVKGTHAYDLVTQGSVVRLAPAGPDDIFDLPVCPLKDASCKPPSPHFRGF